MANQPLEQPTNKPYIWIAVVAVVGLTIVSLCAINTRQGPVTVTTNGQQDVLSVSGTHVLEVAPDQAIMMVGVVTNATGAADASNQNKVVLQRVMDAIRAQGIADADIETTDVYLSRMNEWDPKSQTYIDRGYQQSTNLKVTINDLTKVGKVLDVAVNAGANSVNDVSFTLKPETEERYKQQSLRDATHIATQKAELLANAAGADLGKIVSITEQNYGYTPYVYNAKNVMADGAGSAPTPISPQKVSVSTSVSVAYELK